MLSLLLASAVRAEDWPQFRGVNCSGVSTSRKLPVRFSLTENLSWEATLGEGISCPIVVNGLLYNTAMTGPKEFSVYCHEAATGKPVWMQSFETGDLPPVMRPNVPASSTPTADENRVYVYFSTLGMLALDARTGQQQWHTPLPLPHYLMDWGAAASPVLYDDKVIFCSDDDLNPFLIALDKQTGEVRWRTERGDMLGGYSTPLICTLPERTEIVVAGTGKMKGYDPATGEELWTCNTLVRTIMTTPVFRDGLVYISVQSYGDTERILKFALLEWKDTNQDGKLARAEVPKEFGTKFDKADANQDGFLEGTELDFAFQAAGNMAGGGSIIQAIRCGGSGDVTKSHLVWNLKSKAPSNMASPIVIGDQLLVVKKGGLCSSFDVENGKTFWETKRINNPGEYFASPVAGDGKIYLTAENGFVIVLEQSHSLKVLETNDLGGEMIVATPAIADGRIYFRTKEKLFCIAEPEIAP
ncbi:MAG: PQQ-binding-like beta-propeller repeat protein [Planctomycetaceae bacterium]